MILHPMSDLLKMLSGVASQVQASSDPWSGMQWEQVVGKALELAETESSLRVLGEALRLDDGLELPVEVVVAVYRRLMELGASDVRTKVCFARYLLLHGPKWDVEANSLLCEVEVAARAAGLWDSPHLGHHPVFFADI